MSVETPGTPRVVLVTGGSRGIGRAIARRFQADGDRVVITYNSTAPDELTKDDGETTPIVALSCDVTSPEDVEAAFVATEANIGPVEVLVCCAGIADDALLLRMSEERWARVIETDLTACFRVTKRALAPMVKARSGRIILISSVVAFLGSPGQTNYAAAKAGLVGFARSLAREVASRSITVNVVTPGFVATDMTAALSSDRTAALTAQIPAGRVGEPEEIASAVAFLAARDAGYVTGAVVAVDGGLGMGY
jgi:3-oxoacyl-[acyl-carrier protein] reductase